MLKETRGAVAGWCRFRLIGGETHHGAHAGILERRWAVVRSASGTGIFGANEGCDRLLAPMIDRCRGEDLLAGGGAKSRS
jgi:hypothetical protein